MKYFFSYHKKSKNRNKKIDLNNTYNIIVL